MGAVLLATPGTSDITRLASGMSAPTEAELLAAFKKADKDGNGKLTAGELRTLMEGLVETEEEKKEVAGMIDQIMMMVDQDGDKMLNYEELVCLITGKEPDAKQKMKMMFRMWDTDGSGKISSEELCKAMEMDDDPFMKTMMTAVMGRADADKDGKLNFDEFCTFMDKM